MNQDELDIHFMRMALKEARMAYDADEVPIGAVVVYGNRVIGRGHNLTETLNDVTAHAEMQALTAATEPTASRLPGSSGTHTSGTSCATSTGAA